MLSNNNDKKLEDNDSIHIPSNFHMPTDYETLRQLLEHNHQHHFKSINEMCYGCDKIDNNNPYPEQENETLNEKIEHIQPQNHEHLCSLHALQFYPCLEDNMDIIGELNTYANLDESPVDSSVSEDINKVKPENNTNLSSKPNINLSNVTINSATQENNTYLNNNNVQLKDSFIDNKEGALSMIIPSDYNSNNNLLIQNNQFPEIKDSNGSNQIMNDLISNSKDNIKSTYNVLNNLSVLDSQKLNNQVSSEPTTYTEHLNTLNNTNLENQTTNNIEDIYKKMEELKSNKQIANLSTKHYEYILKNEMNDANNNLNTTSYHSSLYLMDNKVSNNLPKLYPKSHSVPLYPEKNLASNSSYLIDNNNLSNLVKPEIKNELTSSSNSINIPTGSILNVKQPLISQPLINSNTTTSSDLAYSISSSLNNPPPLNSSSFSNITSSTSNIPSSLIHPLSMSNVNPSTPQNINNSINNSTIASSSTVIPATNDGNLHLNIVPPHSKETKSRFTSKARTVAPPLKVNPPKTYVKNTTIRNKSSAIDPEEKRRRNTEASARFRARKKFTEIMLKQQTHDLSCKCCELEKQLAEAKREIYWLKQLLIAKQS